MLSNIEIIFEEEALCRLPEICREHEYKRAFILCGEKTHKIAGEKICKLLSQNGVEVYYYNKIEKPNRTTVKIIKSMVNGKKPDIILGIGGGKNLDIAKTVSFESGIKWISVPTQLPHDGIMNNVATLGEGRFLHSEPAASPDFVIADKSIIKTADTKTFIDGFFDIVDKYLAVKDWKMAVEVGKSECPWVEKAAQLALCAANDATRALYEIGKYKNPLNSVEVGSEFMDALFNCICYSSEAMILAKSTRPASGSGHKWAHSLRRYMPDVSHGESVRRGTYFGTKLWEHFYEEAPFGMNSEKLLQLSKNVNLSHDIDKRIAIKTTSYCPSIRPCYPDANSGRSPVGNSGRYTVIERVKDDFGIDISDEKNAERVLYEIKF